MITFAIDIYKTNRFNNKRAMKQMNKQEEIKALQSLKGDTYFNQFFTSQDIEQMCQNIENDFAIESGCSFYEKESKLRKEILDLQTQSYGAVFDLCTKILDVLDQGYDEDEIYEVVEETIGMDAIIKYKHENNQELTKEEVDYLVSKL